MAEAPKWKPGSLPSMWQPAPADRDVPHPASASAFESLTPSPGVDGGPTPPGPPPMPTPDGGGTAPYVPFDAPLPPPASARPAPPSGRSPVRWATAAILAVGLLAIVGLGIGLLVAMRSAVTTERSVTSDAKARAVLLAAAEATSGYVAANHAYPAGVADLAGYGFTAVPGVELRILRTGGALTDPPILDFCLGAGPSGTAPTLHYQPGALVSGTPCA